MGIEPVRLERGRAGVRVAAAVVGRGDREVPAVAVARARRGAAVVALTRAVERVDVRFTVRAADVAWPRTSRDASSVSLLMSSAVVLALAFTTSAPCVTRVRTWSRLL